MQNPQAFFTVLIILLLVEAYVYTAFHFWAKKRKNRTLKNILTALWWFVVAFTIMCLFGSTFAGQKGMLGISRTFLFAFSLGMLIVKILMILPLLIGDTITAIQWVSKKIIYLFKKDKESTEEPDNPSRKDFINKAALITGAFPIAIMTNGIARGAYNYKVHRVKVQIANLPKKFEGIKIGQLSDIHSGSFFDKTAVQGGIDMLLAEKPDVVLFTGDLVNNQTDEVRDYMGIFKNVKAPLGVYSTLGNHDYGDYNVWPSQKAKAKNLTDMIEVHKLLGWDLLMDESRYIRIDNEPLALIGVQNWGKSSHFPKYGDMKKATLNVEADAKILLSHDPSHWDAQVRPEYKDIDLMLAGHTHGMQFGVEIGDFKWSPIQYMYPQWAGLYKEGDHQLYVNRGYGFLGFPGRIGIRPEITILELTSKA